MKVLIIGSGEMLMSLIAGCEDAGCNIVGVLRSETTYLSKLKLFFKNTINPAQDYIYIKSHNLNELFVKSVNSEKFKKIILKLNPDIILVGSWGEKFKKDIIDLPKICTINVHPSLLPKYRGPNPYLEVIRHMKKESGVTFHLMNENFDDGEILLQKTVEVLDTDTGKELKTRITQAARKGIEELIRELDTDIIIPIKQNKQLITYFKRITEKDLIIDFKKSAKEVAAQIKSLHPWSKAYFPHNSHYLVPNPYKLKILEKENKLSPTTIYKKDYKKRMISIVCGDGKILEMSDIKLFGCLRFLTDIYIKFRIKELSKI
jgi:methionyl-tRNA formyltransferase